MKLKTKAPLPWFGSDARVAAEIAQRFAEVNHMTIPFAGGMSILAHLEGKQVIANDRHALAYNFYRVASDRGFIGILSTMCEQTLSHPQTMTDAAAMCERYELRPRLDLPAAWAFWAVCWVGRKGKGGTKNQDGKSSVRRRANGGANASRISAAAGDLREWSRRFKMCDFTCEDFAECLGKTADDPKNGIYCDAPWVKAGKNYRHPFTEEDHDDLRLHLSRFKKSTVLVRYDDHPLIREIYQGWSIEERSARNQANGQTAELWISPSQEVETIAEDDPRAMGL